MSSLKGRILLEIAGDRVDGLLEEGRRFEAASDLQGAVGVYRQALAMEPNDSRVLHRLGLAAYRIGRLAQAAVLIQRAVETGPDCWVYHKDLGNVYKGLGRCDEAVSHLNRAVSLAPNRPQAYCDLGIVYHHEGLLEQALASYRSSVSRDPRYAPAWNNMGLVLQSLGRPSDARTCFEKAVQGDPRFFGALNNLGHHFKDRRNFPKALERYEQSLAIEPNQASIYSCLGQVRQSMRQPGKAVAAYRQAIDLRPRLPAHWVNLGTAFFDMGRYAKAADCYRNAIQIDPRVPQAHLNLGLVQNELRRNDEAISSFESALELDPDYEDALCNLVKSLIDQCDWEALGKYESRLDRLTERALKASKKPIETPFLNIIRHIDPQLNFQVATAWSRELVEKTINIRLPASPEQTGDKPGIIRLGYLSGNFCAHAGADLILGLLERHDRNAFRVYCYSYGKDDGSAQRRDIRGSCDQFRDVSSLDDASIAGLIHADAVDILVDLVGYTKGCRLGICALRPAPIQVRMLGMAGTTGASFFDYLITDRIVTPEEHQRYYSENFVYMPFTYQVNCYPNASATGLNPTVPVHYKKRFVFASFCTAYKIERDVFDAWMQILKGVPQSELWIMPGSDRAKASLVKAAQTMNVDPKRIIFQEKLGKKDHFNRLLQVDLALDTRTVNGAATTSDALWAGVPVVSVQGHHFASRMSSSLLHSIGLPEMVTHSLGDYIELAIEMATHPKFLEEKKHKLEKNRFRRPLFNTAQFVKLLEAAYRCMWERQATGDPIGPIDVRRLTADSANGSGMLVAG